MKRRNLLFVFTLAFILVVGMSIQIRGESLSQGMEYFNNGEYENAAAVFSDLIDEGEESWQIYYFAGLSYNNIGQPETAIPYFENAYELRPDDYRTVINYTRALYRAESYETAYEVLTGFDGDILDTQYHNLLGLIYSSQGEFESAETAYLEGIEYGDNPYLYNNLGLLLLEDRRYEEAVEYLGEAVALEPNEAFIYNNYGLALLNTGAEAEAIEAFEAALEIDPGFTRAEDNLNRIQGE